MAKPRESEPGKSVDRRKFLELGALTVGATILAGCGGTTPTAAPQSTTAPAGAAPTTGAAAGAATKAPAAAAVPTTASAAAAPTAAATTAAAVKTGATTKQPAEVVFNTWWVPLADVFDIVQKDFQDANPGVTVKQQMITASYVEKMSAALVAGNFGDAATANNGVQSKWMSSGYHVDMTSWAAEDKLNVQQDYGLAGLEIWCGKLLNMPMDNDDRAIYYNKTMIKAAGAKDPWDDLHGKWTWDDMIEIAQKCVKKNSAGKITQYGLMTSLNNPQEIEPYIWSLGGNYANWETGKFTFLDDASVKANEMLYKWATVDKFLITNEAISDLQGASGINPFRGGIVAMYHRASYDATLNQKEIGDKFEWDAAPFPDPGSFAPGKQGVPCSTANPNFVPKGAKNPQLGYKWIAMLAGDKAEELYAKKKTMMVAKKSAWKTYQDTNPPKHPGSFVYYVYGRPHGFHYYSDITLEAFNTIGAELDKAYLGKQTIKQALDTTQQKVDALGKSQSASCGSPYGTNGSPQPALSEAELSTLGVKPSV